MKMYLTFAECKLVNPHCDVYFDVHSKLFTNVEVLGCNYKVEPEDFLMSLYTFLKSGLKLEIGDALLTSEGTVSYIRKCNVGIFNELTPFDRGRFILKSSDLSRQELQIKTSSYSCKIATVKGSVTDLLLEGDISGSVRSACLNLINKINESEAEDKLLKEAYILFCDFYGDEYASYDYFVNEYDHTYAWFDLAKDFS